MIEKLEVLKLRVHKCFKLNNYISDRLIYDRLSVILLFGEMSAT